jgi:hypothetical protein
MSDVWQIQLCLEEIKKAVSAGNYIIWPRDKNNAFLARVGMSLEEQESIIMKLDEANYASGPEEDRDRPGEKNIWKFNINRNGMNIHIKLKLIASDGGFFVKCLSFHD